MILSLEEDEEEFDLQDVTQNVITVDDEYLNGQSMMNARRLALRHQRQETVSVCSCTCYPGGKRSKKDPWYLQLWYKCQRIPKPEDDDHIFCAETMSISKSKKYAVKRNSMWENTYYQSCQNFLLCAKRKNALSPWILANEKEGMMRVIASFYWMLKVPKVFSILWLFFNKLAYLQSACNNFKYKCVQTVPYFVTKKTWYEIQWWQRQNSEKAINSYF